tara:strand:+ start:903 stop:1310 length:408 start_codon:yes stop_codon:yes gene_type:complete
MAVGGDLIEATSSHPTLGNDVFFFKGSEDGTFNIGGFSSNDDNAMVDGSGEMIDIINRKLWSVEGTISWDMNKGGSLAKLQALSSHVVQSNWTFSHANYTIYSGKGKPVGDLAGNTGQATLGIKIQGGGKLSEVS